MTLAHPPSLLRSPLSKFMRTVSAMSSALWPVMILLHPNLTAPLYKACLLNTPQYVQLFFLPMTLTISSMVQLYRSLYPKIIKGRSYSFWFLLTAYKESSLYPFMPSSMANMKNYTPYLCFLFSLLRTWATTVESLPPLVPIAILSPYLNRLFDTIVSCTYYSNWWKKHYWHTGLKFFGRLIIALFLLQL